MIVNANAKQIPLADESVQCAVTSPPYYGLRDYGVDGQIGLEQTPDEFIANIVAVSEEVRRVLKPDGVYFINIGDSYSGSGKGWGGGSISENYGSHEIINNSRGKFVPAGLKPKDLMMIPARVAIALQASGWWLRAEIVWAKPNPMPESVTDRPTRSHEMIYMLTKSANYFYDYEAVREVATWADDNRKGRASLDHKRAPTDKIAGIRPRPFGGTSEKRFNADRRDYEYKGDTGYRNQRDVWTLTTEPYSGSHYAVFPTEIPRRAIKAGSRPGDIVLDPFCGSGTTGIVCRELGRRFVGLDLSMEYLREHALPRAERKQTQESLNRLPLLEWIGD